MENLNSCCFVATINKIKAIEGADNIEQAVIGGWNCIIKKDSYTIGDLVICATTDAVIPSDLSDGLGITNYLRSGGRVRTIKLKGVYSECLIIPITFIPDKYKYEGSDCMELMKIFKYEPPVKQIQLSSGRQIKWKDNQNFHIYYKFPNQKNVPGMFTEEDEVQITNKIHGTNARYGICLKTKLSLWDKIKKFLRIADKWIEYEFVVGSHNCEKGSDSNGYYDTNVWFDVADKYDIKDKLWNFVKQNSSPSALGSGLILYGEIYGGGIQKNYDYGLNSIELVGFDVTIQGKYLPTDLVKAFLNDNINTGTLIPHVEILYEGKWSQSIQDSFVFNRFIPGTKVPEEGIVIKHVSGERNKVSKVINPDYLIYGEKKNIGDSH
jgi:RNA ligase (TIGR02306 family)